jgi:hypothetical protein
MSKIKKQEKGIGGPFLTAALFCDSTILDKDDGSLSVIRIIDQMEIVLMKAPPGLPSETNKLIVPIHGLLSFKTGDAQGDHTVRCVMESPSGKKALAHEQTLPFTPQRHGGANLRLNMTIAVFKGGLFWLHVYLDGKRMTRMPLQITIRREPSPESPDAQPGSAEEG